MKRDHILFMKLNYRRPFKIRFENIESDEMESDQIGSVDTRRDHMILDHIIGDWWGSKGI